MTVEKENRCWCCASSCLQRPFHQRTFCNGLIRARFDKLLWTVMMRNTAGSIQVVVPAVCPKQQSAAAEMMSHIYTEPSSGRLRGARSAYGLHGVAAGVADDCAGVLSAFRRHTGRVHVMHHYGTMHDAWGPSNGHAAHRISSSMKSPHYCSCSPAAPVLPQMPCCVVSTGCVGGHAGGAAPQDHNRGVGA